MLEENLRVTRKVPATSSCHSYALIGSILDIMFLHLPMRQVFCGLIESCCVTSLGLPVSGCQRTASLVRRLNLITTYSGRRRNFSARCYKRICEVITVICLHTLETFLPEYEYIISLMGIISLYFVTVSGRSSCSMCRLEAPRDPGDAHAGPSRCKVS